MKRFLMLALGMGLAFPVGANAQQPAPATDGHDHAHDHANEAKPAAKETTSDYLWRKSDEAFHAGDYERAVALHRAIIAYDPTDVESYSVASWLLWSMGKGDESGALLERGIKANPLDPDMWDAAGGQYTLQKKFKEAQSAYAKSVELAGPNADQMTRRKLAHADEKVGDLSGSVATWQALVRDFPTEAVNKNNLARVEAMQAAKVGTGATAPVAAMAVVALVPLLALRRRKRDLSS